MSEEIQEAVNGSGYPLQIHFEHLIREDAPRHKWKVVTAEHRWIHPTSKEEGYIDLILTHKHIFLTLVIEFKRISGNWNFLIAKDEEEPTNRVKILNANLGTQELLWTNSSLRPISNTSSYCVLTTNGKKDSRTLEKISGELLLSLEQLAIEETNFFKNKNEKLTIFNDRNIYLPVIVTTANLHKIVFDPKNIDTKSGQIISSTVEPINFVRFQKNLATDITSVNPNTESLEKSNRENDRTVIIVNSEYFIEFLDKITD